MSLEAGGVIEEGGLAVDVSGASGGITGFRPHPDVVGLRPPTSRSDAGMGHGVSGCDIPMAGEGSDGQGHVSPGRSISTTGNGSHGGTLGQESISGSKGERDWEAEPLLPGAGPNKARGVTAGAVTASEIEEESGGSGSSGGLCAGPKLGTGHGHGHMHTEFWGLVGVLLRRRRVWELLVQALAMGLGSGIMATFLFMFARELGAPAPLMGLLLT